MAQEQRPSLGLVHCPGGIAHFDTPGAQPFEVAGLLPVDARGEKVYRIDLRRGRRARCDVADEKLVGYSLSEKPIDVPQMAPEQVIELEVVIRRMIVAVPPAPVAAFRDQDLFACP